MSAKVLVVDDEPDLELLIRQKFRRQIRQNLLEFLFASHGLEALEHLHPDSNIDVVLTDINMPEMDGLTLLTRIAQLPLTVKTVIVSAYGDMENIRTAMNLGAFDFLTKPINFNDLEITLDKTIQSVKQLKTALEQERLARKVQEKLLEDLRKEVAERKQAEQQVRDSEKQLTQFLDGIPVGIFIVDAKGKPHYINRIAKQILNINDDNSAAPPDLSEVYQPYLMGTEEIYPLERDPLLRALNGEFVTVDDIEVRHTDQAIFLEAWVTPIFDAHNYIAYAIAAFQDITQRKWSETERIQVMQELESKNVALEQAREQLADYSQTLEHKVEERTKELKQILQELESTQAELIQSEKMAALGQLVAGVAHEVNTPIGCAITAASMLSDKTVDFLVSCEQGRLKKSVLNNYLSTAQQTSEIILSNLQRAGDLIQNFKQVAVDRVRWDLRLFSVKDYLSRTLSSLDPHIKQANHQVRIGGDDFEINSYPGAFSQVITNLVMNSILHAYRPGEQGTLSLKVVMQASNRFILEYSDDGAGIPAENLPKIFEPFFTTARHRGGTGLGLHIVYNIVTQNLQGSIQCHSELGQGTRFVLNLPLTLAEISNLDLDLHA